MYSQKFHRSLLKTKPNLGNVILDANFGPNTVYHYSIYLQKLTSGDAVKAFKSFRTKIQTLIQNEKLLTLFKNNVVNIPKNLKDQSSKILRIWAHQCECVVAQRLRRSQQMFSLYSRIWEETALKEFIKKMRQQVIRQSTEFIVGAVGVAIVWDKARIQEEEMLQHVHELDYINKLRSATVICSDCDNKNMTFCTCSGKPNEVLTYDNWSLFISKDDLLVWRRPHPAGYFEYKVYGVYNDVSAEDFLNVQVDIDYRRHWDSTAVRLELIDSDPDLTKHGDLIYWEMLWPRLFSNRDYVFKRRFMVDTSTNTVLLMNQSTDHPLYPTKSDKYRIRDYWSYMVIKPLSNDFKKPGIEFGLTYYDNPGVNIPTPVMTWVAMRAMPDFLANLRAATKKYKTFCEETGHELMCSIFSEEECRKEEKKENICKTQPEKCREPGIGNAPGSELMTAPSAMVQPENNPTSYWQYIQSTFYIS